MKETFLKELFYIKRIYNALCISDKKNEITTLIENESQNIVGTYTCQKQIIPLPSQMLLDIKKNSLDMIYINKTIPGINTVIDELLSEHGIVIFDNIHSENPNLELIFENNNFKAFQRKNLKDNFLIYDDIMKRIKYSNKKNLNNKSKFKIGIGVFTYNHEKYILDCLESIFNQSKKYEYKVVIIDDASTDATCKIIDNFLKNHKNKNFKVNFIKNKKNKGVILSIKKVLEEFSDTDYFTFCEGDDYWNSPKRIEKFVNYMQKNNMVSMAFNSIYILYDESGILEKNRYTLDNDYYLTQELISEKYFIGNLGCCFYDSSFLPYIDEKIFNLPLYDFFFNIYYSTFGLIGYVREYLSTYRKHCSSFWSSLKDDERAINLYNFVNEYNKYFNFIYDYEFTKFQNEHILSAKMKIKDNDLTIIDNVFPHPLSSFSYEEIGGYLHEIEKSMALCTFSYTQLLDNEPLRTAIKNFKIKNPDIHEKITDYSKEKFYKFNSKLLYFIFKNTVTIYYNLLKDQKIPFVFELYPGGGMVFDDKKCDQELKKIMKLKNFKKVIVTQEPVKEYLIKKKLCKKNQIEMIFGVVMNINNSLNYKKEKFYGENKSTLDIVFMAHRYNKIGSDKGYDIFIETAKKLCLKYNNIFFHVVGNYDENTIELENIRNKITFYGKLTKEEFDNFFKDKDIIISPNRPNILSKGAFDGFPTASVTEAGVRKVLMLCSDELNMSRDYYNDYKDLIIIKPKVDDIFKKIEWLYKNPNKIKIIAENGRKKILKLYSYESQMKPRINLLKSIIKEKIK